MIKEIAQDGCLDDAHDDFVRHLKERSHDFCGEIFVCSDITGKYVKVI